MSTEESDHSNPPPVLEYATPSGRTSLRGVGFLAVAATLLLPGLGHWYGRWWRRGLVWLVAYVASVFLVLLAMAKPTLLVGLLALIPAYAIFQIAMCVDAYRMARRTQHRLSPALRYLIGGITLVIALIAPPLLIPAKVLLLPAVNRHWVEAFYVPTGGMSPLIQPGDRVLCHKGHVFRRWSAVVYEMPFPPGNKGILRVVGLPGETVAVIGGRVHIDGQPISQPAELLYVAGPGWRELRGWEDNPIVLGDDEFFLLGDNSANAYDGRSWRESAGGRQLGAIPASAIDGPVTAIYWPPSRWRRLE